MFEEYFIIFFWNWNLEKVLNIVYIYKYMIIKELEWENIYIYKEVLIDSCCLKIGKINMVYFLGCLI